MFSNRNKGDKLRKRQQRKLTQQRKLLSEQLEDRRLLTAVQQVLFEDTFEASSFLNNSNWITAIGSPTVMSESDAGGPINASGNRALNLDAGWVGSPANDQVVTKSINLNSYASARFSYRVQAEGQGQEPGAGDDLLVQYATGGNAWQTIRRDENVGTNNGSFNTRYFDLPESALQGIQFIFTNLGDYFQYTPTDDWFIDDVRLTAWRPHVTISDASVTEGNTASFNIKLLDDAGDPLSVTKPITVSYSVEVSGTETDKADSADFTPRTGSVTFSPGQTTKAVTVATTQDSIDELTETFQVRLTNAGTRAEITDSIGVGTITDNDPAPNISIAVAGQAAGTSGQSSEGTSAVFDVTLDRQSSRTVTVNYQTQVDTASVDDVATPAGTLTFLPGETSKQITVATLQDDIDEPLETFNVGLSTPANAVISNSTAEVAIVDDDATPTISISSASGTEGDVTSSPLVFEVTLSNPSSAPITVDYSTASQTAIAEEDFASASGTLTFAPGALSQSFSVSLLPDDRDEPASEQFAIDLANPANATIGVAAQGIGAILDDDATPNPILDLAIYRVDEGDGGFFPELQIDASATTDVDSSQLTYRWDIGNDGQIDRVSASPVASFSYQELANLGFNDGPQQSDISLEVSDGTNSSSTLAILVVENSAPMFLVPGVVDLPVEAGGVLREPFFIDDLSLVESHTITVDYGDGSAPSTTTLPPGERSAILEHTYSSTGTFNVEVEVSDGFEPDTAYANFTVNVALGSSLPVVTFDAAGQTINEGEDWTQITATLSPPSSQTVTVPLLLDFTGESDFDISNLLLEFEPGQTTAFVEMYAFPDSKFEPAEQIDVLMGAPSGATLGSQTRHEITVIDSDPIPTVDFASSLSTLQEGETGVLTATLSNPSASEVIVPLQFAGSATEQTSENYLFPGNEIRIPAGATSASKSFLILDDDQAESAQSLFISMGLPTGAIPGPDTVATILIPANDTPIVDLRAASILVDEASGTSNVLVDLSNPIAQQVSVPFTISGTAQDGADFTFSPNAPLVFAPNQTSAAIDLTVIDDLLVEPTGLESVVIEFGQPDVGLLGNTRLFELLIADNDQQTIQFVLDQQEINEDSSVATFSIISNRVAATDISIPVSVVLDSLESNDITGALPTNVVLPAGQTETSFSIGITNDAQNEPPESFTVFLGTPSGGGQLGENDYQKVTVRDDDPFALISVDEDSFDETARTVDFTVRLTEPTNKDVVLNFGTFGNAALGQDFTLAPNSSITIPAGQSEARIKATIRPDATVEEDETVGLRLTGATNALVKSNLDRASIVLRNNDQATVRFSTEAANFDEGTTFQVKVRLSQTLTDDLVIPVKGISGSGKAKLGVDYRMQGLGSGNTVTIPAGQREATFNVSITDDDDYEGSERIVLQLGQPNISPVELDSRLLTFRINASDKLLARKLYFNPGGFGLETYGPGQLAIDPGQLPKMGPNDTLVIETAQGSAIELSQSDVAEFIAQGQLAVNTGENGNNADISSGSSNNLSVGAGVIAVSSGSIEYDPIDPATVLLLKGSPGLANTGNGARLPGTINLAVTSEQGNLFGSTAFFDANRNGIVDFLDLNGDGIQQFGEPTEPSATTHLDGSFELALPTNLDVNGDGILDPRDGQFVLTGGIDTATELPMPLVLEAAVGHYNVSPLSTLAAKLVYDFGTINTVAEQRALSAFGLEGARFSDAQSIAAAGDGDSGAARIAIANAQLQSTVISIGSLFTPLPGMPQMSALGQLIFQDMADKIQSAGSRLNLSSEVQIDSIVSGLEFQVGQTLPSDVRSAAIQAIAEANGRLGGLDVNSPTLLQDRAKNEVFFIGQLAPALSQLSSGSITAADLITNYTGTAAESRVTTAQYGIINPPRVAISSVKTPETDSAGVLQFEVNISGDVTRPVDLSYETVLDDSVAGEVTPVAGTLNWQPGDNSPRIIQVPFQGDTVFEEDESVLLALTSVSNAVLANDTGVGYILNDDALTFDAPAGSQANDLELFIDGQEAQLFANQQLVFDGFHTGGAASTIVGSASVDDLLSIELGEQNTFLTRGLHFAGNGDAGDVLSIENSLATQVVHRSFADGTGEFENDGGIITYANLSSVSDILSPTILGLPSSVAEADEFSLTASIPEILEYGTVSWTLSSDGIQAASHTGANFTYEFLDSGIFELQLAVATGNGRSATRIIPIEVQNLDPTAVIDVAVVDEDAGSTTINVLANDSDPATADTLEVVSVDTTGTVGLVAFTSTSVTYDPNGQFEGLAKDETVSDSFTYTIADGDGGTSTASVIATISGQNDEPQFAQPNYSFNLDENSELDTVVGSVSAVDADAADTDLAYSISAGNTGNAFKIDPDSGVIRVDNFEALDFETNPIFDLIVQVDDNNGLANSTNTANVTIALNDLHATIAISDAAPNEESYGSATFDVVFVGDDVGYPVDVTYETIDGTAENAIAGVGSNDYENGAGVINFSGFSSGEQLSIDVFFNDDTIVENSETFFVRLLSATGNDVSIADDTGMATIINDDSARLVVGDANISEGDSGTTSLSYLVTLSQPADLDVLFDYQTLNGTATVADGDYAEMSSANFVIPSGSTTGQIDIVVNGDDKVEIDEALQLIVSNLNASGRDVQFADTITDQDNAPANTGAIVGSDTYTYQQEVIVGEDGFLAGVELFTSGAGDFNFAIHRGSPWQTGTPEFATVVTATESGSQLIDMSGAELDFIVGDRFVFEVQGVGNGPQGGFRSVSGNTYAGGFQRNGSAFGVTNFDLAFRTHMTQVGVSTMPAVGTILNDDQASLSVNSFSQSEGGLFEFTVTTDKAVDEDITFAWGTFETPGQADSGTDFTPVVNQPATIVAGDISTTFSVNVTDDELVELDEFFRVRIFNERIGGEYSPSRLTVGEANGFGTILNDDSATLTIGDAMTVEGDNGTSTLSFPVLLSQPSDVAMSFDYQTQDGTATVEDMDFVGTLQTQPFTLAANTTVGQVDVVVNSDDKVEQDEALQLVLSSLDATGRDIEFADTDIDQQNSSDSGAASPSSSLTWQQEVITGTNGQLSGLTIFTSGAGDFEFSLNLGTPLQSDGDDFSTIVTATGAGPQFVDLSSADLQLATGDRFAFKVRGINDGPQGGFRTSTNDSYPGRFYLNGSQRAATDLIFRTHVTQTGLFETTGVGKIINDDQANLSISDVSQAESGSFLFTITSDKAASQDITMSVNTIDIPGQAGSGTDYTSIENAIATIPTGSTTTTVEVVVSDDASVEADETFWVRLTNEQLGGAYEPTRLRFSNSNGVGTILNDDVAPIAILDGPYFIDEGHGVTFDASQSSDADLPSQTLFYRWDINNDATFDFDTVDIPALTLSWAQLESLGLSDGLYEGDVTIEVSDGTNVGSATSAFTIENAAPSISMDTSALAIDEGTSTARSIVATDVASDMVAVTASVGTIISTGTDNWLWSYDAEDDLATANVVITAADEDGGSATSSFDLTVNNEAPVAEIAGPNNGVPGQARTFTLSATDPSQVDQHAGFTFDVDWDGDGNSDENIFGSDGTQVQHVFTSPGTYTVGLTATDKDTGISLVSTTSIVIVSARLQGGNLLVGGTTQDDTISFIPGPNPGDVEAILNGASLGIYQPTGELRAYGEAGDDIITIDSAITLPGDLRGDAGNDILLGGGGPDRLIGGDGDDELDGGDNDDVLRGNAGLDTLSGGDGNDDLNGGSGADEVSGNRGDDIVRGGGGADILSGGADADILLGGGGADQLFGDRGGDILIGGNGNDFLGGGSGSDILIGSSTIHDGGNDALRSLLAEWDSSNSLTDRIANLRDGSGSSGGANNGLFLAVGIDVLDDEQEDSLNGNGSHDWFFAADDDLLADRIARELVESL